MKTLKRTFFLLGLCPTLLFAQPKNIKHVIVVGIDGLGANYMFKGSMPYAEQLMKAGSYSLHARCIRPSSSASNWASMMMGAGPELAGYTKWNSTTPEIPPRVLDRYGMFPSIYSLLRDQRPQSTIGVVYSWEGIGYLFPKQAVDKDENPPSDSLTEISACQYIKASKPTFLLIHFDGVDHAGHTVGWGTDAYNIQMKQVDTRIKNIVDAVRQAGLMGSTVILVTADHGGIGTGHGGDSLKELEIPWIMYGAGVRKNNDIQESIMTYDTAATISCIFGLKTPQVWTGRPVKSAFK